MFYAKRLYKSMKVNVPAMKQLFSPVSNCMQAYIPKQRIFPPGGRFPSNFFIFDDV